METLALHIRSLCDIVKENYMSCVNIVFIFFICIGVLFFGLMIDSVDVECLYELHF